MAEELKMDESTPDMRSPPKMRVFITMPTKSVVKSTDRSYLYRSLTRLADAYPITIVGNDAWVSRLYDDGGYAASRALGLGWQRRTLREHIWTVAPYPRDIDVAYAYGQFPRMMDVFRGAVEIPTVWQQTFAPVALDTNLETWDRVIVASRMRAVGVASRIVVPSDISLEHAVRLFPHAADKLSVLPYYLPGLEPLGDYPLAAKLEATGKLKVLFVGKEARRKGLMELVRAWGELAPETRKRMEVTVVSGFLDGPVRLPSEWHHKPFVQDIYEAMGEAHVLAFPTLRDAYGLVLVEGMARGVAILTTSALIQRDIVGPDGGVFAIPTDVTALARAWTVLVHDRARLAAMAHANVARFRARFWHRVVGPEHLAVFEAARAGSTRLQTA